MKKIVTLIAAAGIIGFMSPMLTAYAAGPTLVSAKLTSTNAITLVYSEPVATSPGDYSNFTGSLAGAALMSVNGSGTNTITLTFNGALFQPGASGYLSIGTGVYGITDSIYFSGGTYQVTSAQVPILQSFSATFSNVNNAFSTIGSMVTISFTVNESVQNPTVSILGHTISVNGNGSGPYTVNYTLVSGDQEGTIPVIISFTDTQGNSGRATVNLAGNTNSLANSTGYITSNATTPSVLHIGDSITFTLNLSTALPNARVTGYYNGIPLSWYSTNGGSSYIATYIVASGQSTQTTPLQLTGVTVTDQYGNTSAPISGSDVVKTISPISSAPVIYVATPIPNVVTTAYPTYTFISNITGVIRYSGDCSSQSVTAIAGANTITFNALPDGMHSNCALTVADTYGNTSNQLFISPFMVQTGLTTTPVATTPSSVSSTLAAQLAALQAQLVALQQTQSGQSSSAKVSSYKFLNFLGVGSKGTEVTELQKKLKAGGFFSGSVTGTYGSLTEAAVKKFQSAHGITTRGYVGPATRDALNAE
jgi:large repetitive protein